MLWSRRTAIASVLAVAMCASSALAQFGGRRTPRRASRTRWPTLNTGQIAPDFELPVLKETTDEQGNAAYQITDEKIKLSSFRGKRAVCVFFSSYT